MLTHTYAGGAREVEHVFLLCSSVQVSTFADYCRKPKLYVTRVSVPSIIPHNWKSYKTYLICIN